MQNLDRETWGTFLKFKILTEVRDFARVETALEASGIQGYHRNRDGSPRPLLQRPSAGTGFSRAMGCLARVCAASIPFPAGSRHLTWEEDGIPHRGDRNPNYSLKIETIKRASTDAAVAYRINISDRRNTDENMAHVLTAIYEAGAVRIQAGADRQAWETFGEDLSLLVRETYAKFCNNYDDTDVRAVVDAELSSLAALRVLGNTTNFVARDTDVLPNCQDRAHKLVDFIRACGHASTCLGLDGSDMSRDSLVSELRDSILSELEAFEKALDAKLNKPTKERKRGEKRRASMHEHAVQGIEGIMALAEYHATVLGVMADGIRERAAALKDKARDFLTKDFDAVMGVEGEAVQATTEAMEGSEIE